MVLRYFSLTIFMSILLVGCQLSSDFTEDLNQPNYSQDSLSVQVPQAPDALTAQWRGDTLIVYWTDRSATETYFEIRLQEDTGSWQNSVFAKQNAEVFEFTTTKYQPFVNLKIRAANSYGESSWQFLTVSENGDDPKDPNTDTIKDTGSNTNTDSANNNGTNTNTETNTQTGIEKTIPSTLISPVVGSEISSDIISLHFVDSGTMWLDIGTSLGGDDLLSTSISGDHYSFAGLPTSGNVYIRLWTYLGMTWEYNDYGFVITMSEPSKTDNENSENIVNSDKPAFETIAGKNNYHTLNYSGNEGLQLYTGRDDGVGIDLVVVAEGYTKAQLGQFVRDAQNFIDEAFDFYPLDQHMPAWNIHFLSLPSNQSGADNESQQGVLVDTRFGANFWCGNTERLLCVKTSTVLSTVAEYVPQYDEILVMVNSQKYGGAGYGVGIATVSLADAVVNLIRHEMGHSFAHLADEYTYGKTAPPSKEPTAANVTLEAEPSNLKWKHWLDNPSDVVLNQGDGVGLFEGGVYVAQGVYRPKKNTIMRAFGQPFGEVNAEAWALSVYEHVDPILSTVPSSGDVSVAVGSSTWFALESLYSAEEMIVHWSVNGALVDSSTEDPFYWLFQPESAGVYLISVVVQDDSGTIRRDLDTTARQTIQWYVEVN